MNFAGTVPGNSFIVFFYELGFIVGVFLVDSSKTCQTIVVFMNRSLLFSSLARSFPHQSDVSDSLIRSHLLKNHEIAGEHDSGPSSSLSAMNSDSLHHQNHNNFR